MAPDATPSSGGKQDRSQPPGSGALGKASATRLRPRAAREHLAARQARPPALRAPLARCLPSRGGGAVGDRRAHTKPTSSELKTPGRPGAQPGDGRPAERHLGPGPEHRHEAVHQPCLRYGRGSATLTAATSTCRWAQTNVAEARFERYLGAWCCSRFAAAIDSANGLGVAMPRNVRHWTPGAGRASSCGW